ncbi:hypothetical protein EDD85DRAFT_959070 [Armillaria nabsnona]|nr:hypothetical protein EDD85DRAFT_959070 [Armillaria nabsnona]
MASHSEGPTATTNTRKGCCRKEYAEFGRSSTYSLFDLSLPSTCLTSTLKADYWKTLFLSLALTAFPQFFKR